MINELVKCWIKNAMMIIINALKVLDLFYPQ